MHCASPTGAPNLARSAELPVTSPHRSTTLKPLAAVFGSTGRSITKIVQRLLNSSDTATNSLAAVTLWWVGG